MTPEHERMVSILATILYFARHADTTEGLTKVREILIKEGDTLGPQGRGRVSLRVRMAIERIMEVTYWSGGHGGRYPKKVLELVKEACLVGLTQSRLRGKVSEQTWTEQIAGRANISARAYWPELQNWR